MNITSFLIYCIIVTFTPGPANIEILYIVNNFGARKAMEYTYGATTAFSILLVISAILNTTLMTIVPKILVFMQIIGGIYMLYLAYKIYKNDTSKSIEKHSATFMSGFLMQFVNPKILMFTMTVIPMFITPYYQSSVILSISVITITIIGFLSFITWLLFGTIFKRFLNKYEKIINIIMALFLVYSAIMISGVFELI
ncbi:lysine exporter protein LysE [Gottschalkia acidurici 9a]|uniref:Lysine exporter protein LysE n=1 Tax=Gottschalkia acidurici (strain ATCC 7906 / DSM 604 / BCRC 14475 / CIP 104303 / KCTC 5404 / NCIMB 10678 / 9a) TaxID=1128398 RepID=K0AUP7_GOTA9|nr:LysE family transporter [Gottschalkia acidurici]AFS77603.1 lysine exporter protein LysE [Gottschalkia acidurici 9a]